MVFTFFVSNNLFSPYWFSDNILAKYFGSIFKNEPAKDVILDSRFRGNDSNVLESRVEFTKDNFFKRVNFM